MEYLKGVQDGVSTLIFEWFCQDCIAVMVVQDHDVVVVSAGWSWEFASLVHVNLAQWFHNGSKAGMGLVSIGYRVGVAICKVLGLIVFCGALVPAALVQVTLVHGHGE